ncbi:MAG: aldo/keto reductase [Thermoanaerobacterales bacterium]|nr:aldo/keto reductase [Thermoanaerobacterales bacterium]
MKYRALGTTGLVVSRLCFGTLTISPLQAALPTEEGACVIRHALALGLNFIDFAELYKTHPYVREALRDGRYEAVIATKSYAYTGEMMVFIPCIISAGSAFATGRRKRCWPPWGAPTRSERAFME